MRVCFFLNYDMTTIWDNVMCVCVRVCVCVLLWCVYCNSNSKYKYHMCLAPRLGHHHSFSPNNATEYEVK